MTDHIFNGNWKSDRIEHFCDDCCEDEGDFRKKASSVLERYFALVPPDVLQKNNWKDWKRGVNTAGLLQSIHGLFEASFRRAFASTNAGARPAGLQPLWGVPGVAEGQREGDPDDMHEELAEAQPQPLQMRGLEQHGAEEPLAAEAERKRAETWAHQKQALDLLDSPTWFTDLVMLVQSLEPELVLMAHLLHLSSVDFREEGRRWSSLMKSRDVAPSLPWSCTRGTSLESSTPQPCATSVILPCAAPDTEAHRSQLLRVAFRKPSLRLPTHGSADQRLPICLV